MFHISFNQVMADHFQCFWAHLESCWRTAQSLLNNGLSEWPLWRICFDGFLTFIYLLRQFYIFLPWYFYHSEPCSWYTFCLERCPPERTPCSPGDPCEPFHGRLRCQPHLSADPWSTPLLLCVSAMLSSWRMRLPSSCLPLSLKIAPRNPFTSCLNFNIKSYKLSWVWGEPLSSVSVRPWAHEEEWLLLRTVLTGIRS